MAERTSDWELVHAVPPVWRHRGRGSLWVVDRQLVYLPSASLSDLLALQKSVAELGKPPPAEPVKPAPVVEKHEFPRFVTPHPSHIVGNVPNIYVDGLKFSIDRDSSAVSVMVKDAAEERRLLSPKQWKK